MEPLLDNPRSAKKLTLPESPARHIGTGAFEAISGHVVNCALVCLTRQAPSVDHKFSAIDVTKSKTPHDKDQGLRTKGLLCLQQSDQRQTPDARIAFGDMGEAKLIGTLAIAPQGIKTGDDNRWLRFFWELPDVDGWEFCQSTVEATCLFGGRSLIVDWRTGGRGMIRPRIKNRAVGRHGVAISQMANLNATLYTGERYDSNVAPIVPIESSHVPALWAFCSSEEFREAVRLIDDSLKVTNGTFLKLSFDLDHWQSIAEEEYPNGLPAPTSDDPTQWIFHGSIRNSMQPLQVAVAKMLGYVWPCETTSELDGHIGDLIDKDGIVCIPSVRGEPPAAERLADILRLVYGPEWSPATERALLAGAGCTSAMSLNEWLRDKFFEDHSKHFASRPFIWHLWDGRKDGFSCLVNYHKLSEQLLSTLVYTYLQEWIARQAAEVNSGAVGAELRLAAATELQSKLKLILLGEPPYDVFVRWKPLAQQPVGWRPDLSDGVRINIRPFYCAEILRKRPTLNWAKDGGKDKKGSPWFELFKGERVNDHHVSNAEKRAAQQ